MSLVSQSTFDDRTKVDAPAKDPHYETVFGKFDVASIQAELLGGTQRVSVAFQGRHKGYSRAVAMGAVSDALVEAVAVAPHEAILIGRRGDTYDTFVVEAVLQSPQERKRRVLIFGDSNAWGWKPRKDEGPCRRHADGVRAGCVAARLLGSDWEVQVDGLSNRFTDLDAPKGWGGLAKGSFNGEYALKAAIAAAMPLDAVVLQLGTNDLQTGINRSADDIASAVQRLVDLVRNSCNGRDCMYKAPVPIVLTPAPIVPRSETRFAKLFCGAADTSADLSSAFRNSLPDVAILDLGAVLGRTRSCDGIHFTATEHLVLGEALARKIKDSVAPAPSRVPLDISAHDYASHMHRLSKRSLESRFGQVPSDEALGAITQKAVRSSLVSIASADGPAGVAELHVLNQHVCEIAVSLEDHWQGHGMGQVLFEAACRLAVRTGFKAAVFVTNRKNGPMIRILRKNGASLFFEMQDVEATLMLHEFQDRKRLAA